MDLRIYVHLFMVVKCVETRHCLVWYEQPRAGYYNNYDFNSSRETRHGLVSLRTKDLGGYSVGVPPLPIPNREVKPDSADGTA